MARQVELTVTVTTDDMGANAADRIEHVARRCLGLWFDPQRITIEQTKRPHVDAMTRITRYRSTGW